MRTAYIGSSQRRKRKKLPKPLPRIPTIATPPSGPHSRHARHLEAMPVEHPPLNSDDAGHDEVNDAVCRSRVDSHRPLHQIQLLAIRKLFNESESNFKDRHKTTDEAGSSDAKADRCCQEEQKVHGHSKKAYWPIMQTKKSEFQRSLAITEESSISDEDTRVDGGEPPWTRFKEHREGKQNAVIEERQMDSTDSTCAEWKWKMKASAAWQGGEKPLPLVRRRCQTPTSALNRSVTIQEANPAKQKEASINSRNKKLPSFNSVYVEIPRSSSKVPEEVDLSAKNPNDFSSNHNGKGADVPSHAIESEIKDLSPLRMSSYRRVMDAIKQFEANIEGHSKSTKSKQVPILPPKKRMGILRENAVDRHIRHVTEGRTEESRLASQPLLTHSFNLAADLHARRTQGEEDQEEGTNRHVDSSSSQRMAQKPIFDDKRLTSPQHYRPVGGIDIYTTQGPKLMQEMKDRFRKKHGASYMEPEPMHQPQSASQTDQTVLPKMEKSLDDVQGLVSLPTNLSNDLSHILPCVLKGRPKRAGRLPSRYASRALPTDNRSCDRESKNSTEL
ncbi:conserved hypothetical protein [Echinococcus multilocularis]|uniref:Uncharacterized protein n=1 Tax=Echinococcus multilocularis TaxID=6211 RepID=A0A068Y4V1_ECHMU|nr:conserved hypothetical protein [Echinococcus multilocularis]